MDEAVCASTEWRRSVQLIAALILAAVAAAQSTPNCQYLYTDEQSRQLLVSDGEGVRPILSDFTAASMKRLRFD
jgi:hypothetical protein